MLSYRRTLWTAAAAWVEGVEGWEGQAWARSSWAAAAGPWGAPYP